LAGPMLRHSRRSNDLTAVVSSPGLSGVGVGVAVCGVACCSCAAAANEPAFAQAMKLQGTDVRYMGRPEYAKWLKQNDDLNRNLAKDLGLLKR